MGAPHVRYEVRGSGEDVVVLLHGLNGTTAVWESVDAVLARTWPGRRVLVDLPGHGGSEWLDTYALGVVASTVASALREFVRPVRGKAGDPFVECDESVDIVGEDAGGCELSH